MNAHRFPIRMIAVLGLSLCLRANAAAADETLKAQVDRLIEPLIESETVVGLSIGLVHGGTTDAFSYGKLATDRARSPNESTLFEIGSVSKCFTGLLLADAIQRGEVQLDDPVQKYLPDDVKMPRHGDRPITLRDLATHTSGLPRMPGNIFPQIARNPQNPYVEYSLDDLYKFLNGYTLTVEPGKRFEYSNLGVGLLGQVLARRAETTYEELLIERICKPLRLVDTCITLRTGQQRSLAQGHDSDGAKLPNWDLGAMEPAGGIRSNVSDMLRFVRAQLGLGERPLAAVTLSSGNLMIQTPLGPTELPLADAIEFSHQPRFDMDKEASIALCWHIRTQTKTIWHNGQTGGYHSFVGFRTRPKIGVVVLCNSAGGTPDELGERLLQLLAGEKVEPLKVRQPLALSDTELDRCVGVYEGLPGMDFHVFRDGRRLLVQLASQPRLRIYAESETEFFYRAVKARITFSDEQHGKFQKLVLHQNGLDFPAWRGGVLGQAVGRIFQRKDGESKQ